ncbi:MAG: (2Fe-2S)-binding protein [Thermaerobacter sp.]|nr:(2Fe-2S)-binding protein [Thermaerobacter sp.]
MQAEDRIRINLTVNGSSVSQQVEARRTLADFLRYDLGLTGTHTGCEQGACGACTVLLDGVAVRSCLIFASQLDGAAVETVEGLANESLHPLQEAFHRHHALQCGYCTPGFLMAAKELLTVNPDPSETEIRQALSGQICRCTGYENIVQAVREAADTLHGAKGRDA